MYLPLSSFWLIMISLYDKLTFMIIIKHHLADEYPRECN